MRIRNPWKIFDQLLELIPIFFFLLSISLQIFALQYREKINQHGSCWCNVPRNINGTQAMEVPTLGTRLGKRASKDAEC